MAETRKNYAELKEFAVEQKADDLRLFQMHSSYLQLDGWTNADMAQSGFALLRATFKTKSMNNGSDEILREDPFTKAVREPKERLHFSAYNIDSGYDIDEWRISCEATVKELNMERGRVTSLPIAVKTMRIRSLSTSNIYDWKYVEIPSIHHNGYEEKLILVKINNALPSVIRKTGNKTLLKSIKQDLRKITEIYCKIEPGGTVHRQMGSCAS